MKRQAKFSNLLEEVVVCCKPSVALPTKYKNSLSTLADIKTGYNLLPCLKTFI